LERAAQLDDEIASQFAQGTDGLHDRDHHFILRGADAVAKLSGTDQRNWLLGVKCARRDYERSVGQEIQRMRSVMDHWLLSTP
jgi:hypothetical protein